MKKVICIGVMVIMFVGLFAGCSGEKKLSYNTVIMGNGSIEDFEITGGEYFKESFLEKNMTGGAIYKNPNWDPQDEWSDEYLYDETSPSFRTHIVREQSQLDTIFTVPPQVDFEGKMIIVYMFTMPTNRQQIIKNLSLEDKTLKIEFTTEKANSGYNDGTMPKRRFLVIKLDKLDITEARFVRT